MDSARAEQFRIIEDASTRLLAWAKVNKVDLYRVEYVVPFVETDFGLSVWLFYRSSCQVETYDRDGTTCRVQEALLKILVELGYPRQWVEQVTFQMDSDENVQVNYEGSYFYRLR